MHCCSSAAAEILLCLFAPVVTLLASCFVMGTQTHTHTHTHIIQTYLNYVMFFPSTPELYSLSIFIIKITAIDLRRSPGCADVSPAVCEMGTEGLDHGKNSVFVCDTHYTLFACLLETLGGDAYANLVLETCSHTHTHKQSSRKRPQTDTLSAPTYKHKDTQSQRRVCLVELSDICLK